MSLELVPQEAGEEPAAKRRRTQSQSEAGEEAILEPLPWPSTFMEKPTGMATMEPTVEPPMDDEKRKMKQFLEEKRERDEKKKRTWEEWDKVCDIMEAKKDHGPWTTEAKKEWDNGWTMGWGKDSSQGWKTQKSWMSKAWDNMDKEDEMEEVKEEW